MEKKAFATILGLRVDPDVEDSKNGILCEISNQKSTFCCKYWQKNFPARFAESNTLLVNPSQLVT